MDKSFDDFLLFQFRFAWEWWLGHRFPAPRSRFPPTGLRAVLRKRIAERRSTTPNLSCRNVSRSSPAGKNFPREYRGARVEGPFLLASRSVEFGLDKVLLGGGLSELHMAGILAVGQKVFLFSESGG